MFNIVHHRNQRLNGKSFVSPLYPPNLWTKSNPFGEFTSFQHGQWGSAHRLAQNHNTSWTGSAVHFVSLSFGRDGTSRKKTNKSSECMHVQHSCPLEEAFLPVFLRGSPPLLPAGPFSTLEKGVNYSSEGIIEEENAKNVFKWGMYMYNKWVLRALSTVRLNSLVWEKLSHSLSFERGLQSLS